METTDSLTAFFYNIVPGLLFLLGLQYLLDLNPLDVLILRCFKGYEAILVIAYLSISLLVGFIFQGFTKFVRKHLCMNETAYKKVKKDALSFKNAKDFLKQRGLMTRKEEDDLGRFFYLMHNYIEAKHFGSLPKFFSLRLAFWSNMFFAVLFLILVALYKNKLLESVLLLFLLIYSWWLFKEYLRIFYDTVLKSFVSVVKIDKEGQNSKGGKK